MSTAESLADALAQLTAAARRAQIDINSARAEGTALAATIAEAAPGAYVDWANEQGLPPDAEAFFSAAQRGRRMRATASPTLDLLRAVGSAHLAEYARALAEVSTAAAGLGRATPRTVGNAALAAAAQLSVLPPPPITPIVEGLEQVDPPPRGTQSEPSPALSSEPPEAEPDDEPEPVPPSLEELLAELDALIGLSAVKSEIHRQAAVLRVEGLRSKAGLKGTAITRHLVFTGNPGTGKTTVARLVAGIYRALGLLSTGQLVEVDRSELVAGFLGQTAIKTAEVVASAEGGVLFVDEAYSLSGDQYGTEAIDTLVKEMEDKRHDLVIIVAGYPAPMARFIAENPGLASRFRTTIDFADYTDTELWEILRQLAQRADYDLAEGCRDQFTELVAAAPRGPSFGNGRFARNTLEGAVGRHAWRLREEEEPTLEALRTLLPTDLAEADNDDTGESGDPEAVGDARDKGQATEGRCENSAEEVDR